jgi:hypothetical protein
MVDPVGGRVLTTYGNASPGRTEPLTSSRAARHVLGRCGRGRATGRVSVRPWPHGTKRGTRPAPAGAMAKPATWPGQEAPQSRVPRTRRHPAPAGSRRTAGRVRPLGSGPHDGPWEHGPPNVATLVERRSRCVVPLPSKGRKSTPIIGRLAGRLAILPAEARRCAAFDHGGGFAARRALDPGLGPGVVPRASGAPVEGHGREDQPAPAPPPAPGHRRPHGDGSDRQGASRPPQRHAPHVPRMAHPGRGIPRRDHGAPSAQPMPPPHLGWNSSATIGDLEDPRHMRGCPPPGSGRTADR